MYRFNLDVARERVYCSWPCEKNLTLRSIPGTLSVCIVLYCIIVIANANLIGNWVRLNWKGKSEGIIAILDIKTVSPVPQPVNIVHSINKLLNCFIFNLIPLQSLSGLKFPIKIIGATYLYNQFMRWNFVIGKNKRLVISYNF